MGDLVASRVDSFPSIPPFPDDLPTAPLVTLSLTKLVKSDPDEVAALFKASKDLGFFYLDMLGTEEGQRFYANAQALGELEKRYFDLPEEEKKISDRDTTAGAHGFFGYKSIGKSAMDKTGTPDRTEIYNLRKDDLVGTVEPLPAPELIRSNLPLFKGYARAAHGIVDMLLHHLNDQLELAPGTLPGFHRLAARSGDHVRFIGSPEQPKDYTGVTGRAHTDFGSLTILFNWLGGLQVVLPGQSKEWVWVRPVPGCAIVNLGDALVKFTGGLLRSNIHRTVPPPGAQAGLARYSLVYFSRPEDAVVLKRLKGGLVDAQPMSATPEEEYTSHEWVIKRGTTNKRGPTWTPENWEKSRGTENGRD